MTKLTHSYRVFIFLVFFTLFAASCGQSSSGVTGQPTQKAQSSGSVENGVAFIYKDTAADYNWSHLHELGRQYLVSQIPDVQTKFVESVTVEKAEQTLRDLAKEGYKLIFATSPEFSDAVLKVAKDLPDVRFEVAQGSTTADNVATYNGRMYQMFYIAGGYTGEMTESDIIGFVAPEPTVEVIRHINAITMSSRLVRTCEPITVHVKWTGSWNDPKADRKAALELIAAGADVLVQHTYDPEVQKVAEEKGVRSVGYGFDMREFAPKANMTSIIWNWGEYYVQRVNAFKEGKWEAKAYMGKASTKNFGKGIIDLAPYTYDQIPQIMEAPPMKWRTSYNETKKDALDGPIYAQNGDLVLAKGDKFSDEYIYNEFNWFVEGVVGEAPGTLPDRVDGQGADIKCADSTP